MIDRDHKFWQQVNVLGIDDYWEWKGRLSGKNADRAYYYDAESKKDYVATRFMLSPPSHLFVCHKCDNPKCVNPGHLFLGTNQDNILDASRKGRLFQQDKDRCVNGHEFLPDNLKETKGRNRVCRVCANQRNREYRQRIKTLEAMQARQ